MRATGTQGRQQFIYVSTTVQGYMVRFYQTGASGPLGPSNIFDPWTQQRLSEARVTCVSLTTVPSWVKHLLTG